MNPCKHHLTWHATGKNIGSISLYILYSRVIALFKKKALYPWTISHYVVDIYINININNSLKEVKKSKLQASMHAVNYKQTLIIYCSFD